MAIDLSKFTQDSASGLMVPTLIRRTLIPLDDLDLIDPPRRYSQLAADVMPSLSTLVVQGPTVPRLVRGDDAGRVRTDVEVNASVLIGRSQVAADTQIQVVDPTFFNAGDGFIIIPASGAAIIGPFQIRAPNVAAPGLFDLTGPIGSSVAVGDSARRFPIFALSTFANYVKRQEDTFQWDQTSGTVGSGVTPLAQSPVDVAGARIVVTWITAYIRNSANTLYDGELQIIDPGGTVRWHSNMQLPATNPVNDRYGQSGLTIKNGPVGGTWKATLSAPLGAGEAGAITFGGWINEAGF